MRPRSRACDGVEGSGGGGMGTGHLLPVELKGHPKTNKAYAWAHDTEDPLQPKRQVTVLHIPPVTSPELAVRAAIVQEYRKNEQREEN